MPPAEIVRRGAKPVIPNEQPPFSGSSFLCRICRRPGVKRQATLADVGCKGAAPRLPHAIRAEIGRSTKSLQEAGGGRWFPPKRTNCSSSVGNALECQNIFLSAVFGLTGESKHKLINVLK
jgi:hypothetical protein